MTSPASMNTHCLMVIALGRISPAPSTLRLQSVSGTSRGLVKENVASHILRTRTSSLTTCSEMWEDVHEARRECVCVCALDAGGNVR